jgi:hypothetical protein
LRAFRRRGGVIKTADEADACKSRDEVYTRTLEQPRRPFASRPCLSSKFFAAMLRSNFVIHATIRSEVHVDDDDYEDDDDGDNDADNIKINNNTDYLREQ